MSDLAAKLSLRRKGISGSREGGSIMDKLLASIPPPPARKESSESDGSDTTEPDWDDWKEKLMAEFIHLNLLKRKVKFLIKIWG